METRRTLTIWWCQSRRHRRQSLLFISMPVAKSIRSIIYSPYAYLVLLLSLYEYGEHFFFSFLVVVLFCAYLLKHVIFFCCSFLSFLRLVSFHFASTRCVWSKIFIRTAASTSIDGGHRICINSWEADERMFSTHLVVLLFNFISVLNKRMYVSNVLVITKRLCVYSIEVIKADVRST